MQTRNQHIQRCRHAKRLRLPDGRFEVYKVLLQANLRRRNFNSTTESDGWLALLPYATYYLLVVE